MEASKFNIFSRKIVFLANFWSNIREILSVWDEKTHQNLGLGVIYRTVPSESHNSKRIMLKIIKMDFDF